MSVVKNNARKRGIGFGVTIEYVARLLESQGHKCAMTGYEIGFVYGRKASSTASLDRIDSKIGYFPGNLQWLHKDVNAMKTFLPDSRVVELCLAVAKHKSLGE